MSIIRILYIRICIWFHFYRNIIHYVYIFWPFIFTQMILTHFKCFLCVCSHFCIIISWWRLIFEPYIIYILNLGGSWMQWCSTNDLKQAQTSRACVSLSTWHCFPNPASKVCSKILRLYISGSPTASPHSTSALSAFTRDRGNTAGSMNTNTLMKETQREGCTWSIPRQ